MSKRKLALLLLVVGVLLTAVFVTYALYTFQKIGEKPSQVTTGTLTMQFSEKENAIDLTKTVPMSDAVGETTVPYIFTIKNTGSIPAYYRLRLVVDEEKIVQDNCQQRQLPLDKIKYQLLQNTASIGPFLLSTSKNGMIDIGTLQSQEISTYSLRLWVDSSATNEVMGKHFHGKIVLEALQGNNQVDFDDYVRDGLLVWYDGTNHGSDPSIWQDLSGNAHHGSIRKNGKSSAGTWTNQSLQVDGISNDVYVTFPASDDAFTITLYYDKEIEVGLAEVAPQQYASLLFFNNWNTAVGSEAGLQLFVDYRQNATNLPYFRLLVPSTTTTAYREEAFTFSRTSTKKGEMTVAKDATGFAFYHNGVKIGVKEDADFVNRFAFSNPKIWLGCWGNMSHCVKTQLYSFRYYDRSLREEEVRHNYLLDQVKYGS